MSEESGKSRGGEQPQAPPPPYYYGTFQGVANYNPPPPHPVVGLPQPAPPVGASVNQPYYSLGYQTVPGYAIAEGRPMIERRLPCCGIGIGWCLFLTGFFLGAIPWYIGALILLFARVDYREKPGLVACMIAAILALIAVSFGVTKATHSW